MSVNPSNAVASDVTSTGLFKNLRGRSGAWGGRRENRIGFDPSQYASGKSAKVEESAEEKANALEEKAGAFEEQFKATRADEDAAEESGIGWGAHVEHDDYEELHNQTSKLVNEFLAGYSSSGNKVKEERGADLLSKLMVTMSWKSESEPELLKKTQLSAYRAVGAVLNDLPRAGIDADLKAAVLDLINPGSNGDPNQKVRKILNFIKDASPEELAKKNSKIYTKIQKAFDLKVNGQVYKDAEGNSVGSMVVDLVRSYIDPVIKNVTDHDSEASVFDTNGQKALSEIRKQIVDAAISQAKDDKTIMSRLAKGAEFTFGNEKRTVNSLSDGTRYDDYAAKRLDLIKQYYIDPKAENREAIVKHYAQFSAEMAEAEQKADLSQKSLDLLNQVSRNRKFNNVVLVPPELVKKEEAKGALESLYTQKLGRIKDLEEIKATVNTESISGEDVQKAARELLSKLGTDASKTGSDLGLKGVGTVDAKDLKAIAAIASGTQFEDKGKLKGYEIKSSDTTKVPDELKEALWDYVHERKTEEVDKVLRDEKKVLLNLLGESNKTYVGVDVIRTVNNINKDPLFMFGYTEDMKKAIIHIIENHKGATVDELIEHLRIEAEREGSDLFEEIKKEKARPHERDAEAGRKRSGLVRSFDFSDLERSLRKLVVTTDLSKYTNAYLDSKTHASLVGEKNKIDGLSEESALTTLKQTGTYTYRVLGKNDDISSLKQEVRNLHSANTRELGHLRSVRRDLNTLIQDHFTRGGIDAVSKSLERVLETTFLEGGSYTGDGVRHLSQHEGRLLKNHNAFVDALRSREGYLQAQKASAYTEIITSNEAKIAGQETIKDQVNTVLGLSGTAAAGGDSVAITKLITTIDEAYKKTNNGKFILTEDDRKALKQPDYRDPVAMQKREIIARQALLSYMEGAHNLKDQVYRDHPEFKTLVDRIQDLGISKSSIVASNSKISKSRTDVDKEYDRQLESVSKDVLPSNKVQTLEGLVQEEQDMKLNNVGGKGFLAAATNFVNTFLTDLVTSIAGGRKDAARDFAGKFGEVHQQALDDAGDPIAERVKEFMTVSNPFISKATSKV